MALIWWYISAVTWNSPGQTPETSCVVPRDHMKMRSSLRMSGMGKSLMESEPLLLRGLEGQQVGKRFDKGLDHSCENHWDIYNLTSLVAWGMKYESMLVPPKNQVCLNILNTLCPARQFWEISTLSQSMLVMHCGAFLRWLLVPIVSLRVKPFPLHQVSNIDISFFFLKNSEIFSDTLK